MLIKVGFIGTVEIMLNLKQAIQFFNKIHNDKKEHLGEADLVFATYDFANGMDLDIFDRLKPQTSSNDKLLQLV